MARICRALLVVFIALEMADLAVTFVGLAGGASEGNPLMIPLAHFWPVLALVKLVTVGVVSGVVLAFFRASPRGQFIGAVIASYGCVLCGAVVAHNVALLTHLPR